MCQRGRPRRRARCPVRLPHPFRVQTGMTHFVNLNATWDTVLLMESLKPGAVNRSAAAVSYPGGKGNNAARSVALLGGKPKLFAFCGIPDKAAAAEFYKKAKVEAHLHAVQGRNRPC